MVQRLHYLLHFLFLFMHAPRDLIRLDHPFDVVVSGQILLVQLVARDFGPRRSLHILHHLCFCDLF